MRDPIVALLAVAVLAELVYVLVFTIVIPPADVDAVIYHLPRAAP